ncbi:MAG: DUF58 domain-containing protein [Sandaracinus sp.]|nr:DUF58 domain-containing protein [Sandaracinus sp.]MCB9635079.1 DUF58 domain-containing protein [Sandaracinus sp.]
MTRGVEEKARESDTSRASRATDTPRSPLDPEVARRAAALSYRAKSAVEGLLSGMHRSPHRGPSVVFVEHRDYRPGDEPRLLDWRAFARTDRHVVKRFEQETQLRAWVLLDRSASMAWGGFADDPSTRKDAHGAALLAALSYLLLRQGDAAGGGGFDVALHDDLLPPGSRPAHFEQLMLRLARPASADAHTDLAEALRNGVERAGRRGVVAVASDFLDRRVEAFAPLAQLVARGHEVVVFHVLHRDELELPLHGAARFLGLEGEAPVEADLDTVREDYLREVRAFVDATRDACAAAGARYLLTPTDTPVERSLAELVGRRRRR